MLLDMDIELDIIYNNYVNEENKNRLYLRDIELCYLNMIVIYYNLYIFFWFYKFCFQSFSDHKFKLKI